MILNSVGARLLPRREHWLFIPAGVIVGLGLIVLLLYFGRTFFVKTGTLLHTRSSESIIASIGLILVYSLGGYYAAAIARTRELATGLSLACAVILILAVKDQIYAGLSSGRYKPLIVLVNLVVPAVGVTVGAMIRRSLRSRT